MTPVVAIDAGLKKLNSTSKIKKLNTTSKSLTGSTKSASIFGDKTLDLIKASGDKNNMTKSIGAAAKETKIKSDKKLSELKSEKPNKNNNQSPKKKSKKQTLPSWIVQDDDNIIFVADLKDIPSRFQRTVIPDLERLSMTSKVYITKANKDQ